jgi:hypothetical protein
MSADDLVSAVDFAQLGRVSPRDVEIGARVFVPGAGTVLLGGAPVFGVTVVGRWWTLHDGRWPGWITARRNDGHEWHFEREQYAHRTLYVAEDA